MAGRWEQLQDLAVGDIGALPLKVTARGPGGITLAPVTRHPTTGAVTTNGEFTVSLAGAISGPGWTTDPKVQPVLSQVRQLLPGDLLQGADEAVTMALAVGLGDDGTLWSAYPDGRSPQPQDGFTVVGHHATP